MKSGNCFSINQLKRKRLMCKSKFSALRLPVSASISAIIAFAGYLLPQRAEAQCDSALSLPGSYQLTFPSGGNNPELVHFGDTIMVSTATIRNAGANSLGFSNAVLVIVTPDNVPHFVINSVQTVGGSTCFGAGGNDNASFKCPGGISQGGATGNCGPDTLPFSYVVRTNDIGKFANFFTNYSNVAGTFSGTCQNQALPKQIIFGGSAFGDTVSPDFTISGGSRGCPSVPVQVITPCISITKFCMSNCPASNPGAAVYGQAINVQGDICNTGDSPKPLTDIQVTDVFSGPIVAGSSNLTFAPFITGTSIPFNPATGLANGQCVHYMASYQPLDQGGSSLCGPFGDTISVTAADGTFLNGVARRVSNTDPCYHTTDGTNYSNTGPRPAVSASCSVCTAPCIAVTKNCDTVVLGFPNTISGSVSNCGNVTLTNVVLTDNVYGSVATFTSLAPGASQPYSKQVTNNTCGNFPDTVTATGVGLCGGQVSANATAHCIVTESPCIHVTKLCDTVGIGHANTVTAIVTNCGNVALHGITVTDNLYGSIGTTFSLPVGGTTNLTKSVTNGCGPWPNTVTATGLSPCNTLVSNTSMATCVVTCTPAIKVYKQVVCYASGGCASFNADLTTQKTATGVRIDPQNDADCPAFCYRITVVNSGNVPLSNVVVTDANNSDGKVLNLSGCGFPTTLPVGGSASCMVTTNHCVSAINVVTANGTGQDSSGAQVPVQASDTNSVLVLPISVSCSVQVLLTNGNAAPTPPTCLTPGTPYIVRTIIINNGQFDLQNVQVTSTGPDQLCNSPFTIANLAVNARRTNDCPFTCDVQSTHTYAVSVSGVASQTTTNGVVCDHNIFGQQIVASNTAPCSASVCCAGCPKLRVTKGVACVICTTNANGVVLECASFNGQFNKDAFGIRSDTQEPAFCYEITVSNTGDVPLVNLVVSDNRFGVLTNNITLGVGGELVFRLTTNWISFAPNDKSLAYAITNTVTASSTSSSYIGCPNVDSGGTISSSDFAIAHVRPLAITCEKLVSVNGSPATDSFSASGLIVTNIVWYAVVHNTGQADATNVVITESNNGNQLPCSTTITIPLLDAGNSTGLIPLCTNGGFGVSACVETNINNSIQVVAQAAAEGTNCVWDINGSNITARTSCQATVNLTCPKAGCTPGFWKNCTIHWGPTGYSTDQSVSSVFSLGNCCTSLGSVSLINALSLPGGSGTCGGAQILLHAAVAGLLNASSPELGGLYPLTAQQVIGMVNAALQSCDRDMMTTLGGEIDRDNNSGCNGPNGGLPCHRLDLPRFSPTKVLEPTRTAPTAPTR
jgi:hypothetical protein